MPAVRIAVALAVLRLSASPSVSDAAVVFASDPHVLVLEGRQQVVLFSQADPSGALATRRSDGTFDVVVPDAQLNPSLLDREFLGPAVGAEGKTTGVSFEQTDEGDVRIHVRPAGAVARVVPQAVKSPARLLIDLLPADAEVAAMDDHVAEPSPRLDRPHAKPVHEAAPQPKAESTVAPVVDQIVSARAEPSVPEPSASSAGPASSIPVTPLAPANATTSESPRGESVRWPIEEPAFAARQTLSAQDTPAEPVDPAEPVAPAEPVDRGDLEPLVAVQSQPPAEAHCRFLRIHGIAFCAPEPNQPGYHEDPYAAGVAHRIAAGATWLAPIQMADGAAAAAFLRADREFLLNAEDGWLLRAAGAYHRAAVMHPTFPDVARAYMNVALIYSALGFEPELEVEARAAANPARDFARALLGDVRREEGRLAEAASLYELASQGTQLPACLAARGFAAIALAEGRTERAQVGVAGLAELCPTELVIDPDTERLRAGVQLAMGEPAEALATLAVVSARVSRSQRAGIARDRASIAETTGREDVARGVWADFESGKYGQEGVLDGAIALARLDGTPEAVERSVAHTRQLAPAARQRALRALFVGVSETSGGEGDELAILSMILAEGLTPDILDVPARVRLATAYRKLGLLAESASILDEVARSRNPGFPEAYWKERAIVAMSLDDEDGVRAALARWRASRGGNPSAGELGIRVLLMSRSGAPMAELEKTLVRLGGLDEVAATVARWGAARERAAADPRSALALLGGEAGLTRLPELPEQGIEETLWGVGRAAEAEGEFEAAILAYRALSEHRPATTRGADASYRAARLLEQREAYGEARREYRRAETHPDALDRRFAEAASRYHEVVQPWTRRQEEP